jgi:hypothetical protein
MAQPLKRYKYSVVHAVSPAVFERQLNAMAAEGWRLIAQSFKGGDYFVALMEIVLAEIKDPNGSGSK